MPSFFNKLQGKSVFIKIFDHSTFDDPNATFLAGRLYEKGIKTIGGIDFKYGTQIYKGKRDYSLKRIYTHSPNPGTTLVVMYTKNLYKGTNIDWSADFKNYSEWQKDVIESYLSDAEESFTILELSNYDLSMCGNP